MSFSAPPRTRQAALVGGLAAAIATVGALSAAPSRAEPPTGYYSAVDASNAERLRASLHATIDDHTRYPYTASATDTWDILESAADSSHVTAVYHNTRYTKVNGGNNQYNREHTWPKSYGFPDNHPGNYPYTDTHQLYLSHIQYNSWRGNKYFDDCHADCIENVTVRNDGRGGQGGGYPGDSNWTDEQRWEVWSERKGDIARAMFYMAVRYEGGQHATTGHSEPDLRLTDNPGQISQTGHNASVAYMGLLSTLLQWHTADPVDAGEQARNDAVQAYQGNRNPFVDHPEWVVCLYANNCTSGSGHLGNGASLDNLSAAQGEWLRYTVEVPAGSDTLAVSIDGGSGDADLYTRYGSEPGASSFDCRPYIAGNSEHCAESDPNAGAHHIGIRAYRAFSGLTLAVHYGQSGPGGDGATHTNLSGAQGQWQYFSIEVPAGTGQLTVTMSGGSGDGDLYLRRDTRPTANQYACRPYRWGNAESCAIDNPAAGVWHMGIYGYEHYEGVTLDYRYQN